MTTAITVKEEIDQITDKIKAKLTGYRDRPSQKIMISAVAKTFWNAKVFNADEPTEFQNIISIEAPTGTGKSQGYLLPSILVARRKGKKVVVSSATVKLQQQLCENELPRLSECFEGGISYMIAKGRTRYVCPLKLEKEAGAANQMSLIAESNGRGSDERDTQIINFHESFNKKSWDGERDSIKADDALWSDISTDASGCLGNRCSKVKQCPFFLARARLDKVDVVVSNHDLLLSDLSLGGGVILPSPEDTYYVIDEAHHLPEKTLSAFASNYASHNVLRALEKMSNEHAKSAEGSVSHQIHKSAETLFDYVNDLTTGLEQIASLKEKGDVLRFPFGNLPDGFVSIGKNIINASDVLVEKLSEYIQEIEGSINEGESNPKLEKELTDTSLYLERATSVQDTWRLMCKDAIEGQPPIAKWVELVTYGKDLDYLISASPVSAGLALKHSFWDKALGVVLTSATLTALGRFDLFLYQTGLAMIPERVRTIALPSPFDYQTQGKLVLPKMQFSPKDVVGHTAEVIKILPNIYPEHGGMLVLFTSRKQMTEVRDGLPAHIKELTMMQGDMSNNIIIAEHKKRIESGFPNTVFGLNGLAEGIDLPGDLCLRVVIVKIPFDVPSDPIGKGYSEWLESIGRNPFYEVSLPAASRKLNQHSGRLLRRETDEGQIYCLDSRLSNTKYGSELINSLPPYKLEKNVVIG